MTENLGRTPNFSKWFLQYHSYREFYSSSFLVCSWTIYQNCQILTSCKVHYESSFPARSGQSCSFQLLLCYSMQFFFYISDNWWVFKNPSVITDVKKKNLKDFKSSEVSRTLLSILTDLNDSEVWMVLTLPISKSHSIFQAFEDFKMHSLQ